MGRRISWKKSDHPTTVRASIRVDNNVSSYTNGKSISVMCGNEFKMKGDGEEHLASSSGMDLLNCARAEQSGGWGGGEVSISDRVEALF